MMVFITHCWKSASLVKTGLRWLVLWVCLAQVAVHAQSNPEITQFSLENGSDGLRLSAALSFDLSPQIEDALNRGVPIAFVAQADVMRQRWYWIDKKVSASERHMRLSYQALTRKWRLNSAAGAMSSSGLGLVLNQTFDTLADAMGAVKRVNRWQIAEAGELDPAGTYQVEFRFQLDVSQLPRPLQIGAIGQADWNMTVSSRQPVPSESAR